MKLGEYFVAKEKMSEEQIDRGLKVQEKNQGYLGEILVNLEYVEESDLLVYLSKKFKVQYISSDKLKKMAIKENIADIIPYKFALENYVFPLKFRASDGKLNLLTHEPQNDELMKKVKLFFSDITRIEPVIAHSRAIKALILKQYSGDLAAFERLVEKGINLGSMTPQNEVVFPTDSGNRNESSREGFSQIINQGEILNENTSTSTFTTGFIPDGDNNHIARDDITRLIKVFSSILDAYRGKKFKAHTYRVASLCRALGKTVGLSEVELNDVVHAAFLHDAGQKYHLSAFDIKDGAKRETIIKYANLPRRLFASLNFLQMPVTYLSSMYETYNGEGYPNRLRLQEIPICSQILLLADTYDYVTNVLGTPVPAAFEKIRALHFFSSELLETFRSMKNISPNRQKAPAQYVLVMSADKTTLYDINEQLSNHNFMTLKHAHLERGAVSLKKNMASIRLVLCDINAKSSRISPLKFIRAMKSDKRLSDIPFVLFSAGRIPSDMEKKAIELGAEGTLADFTADNHIDQLVKIARSPRSA